MILQAKILEWVAMPFSRGSSWPRDWTQVSHIASRLFTISATWEAPTLCCYHTNTSMCSQWYLIVVLIAFLATGYLHLLKVSWLLPHNIKKINSRWIHDLNVINETIKLLKNTGEFLYKSDSLDSFQSTHTNSIRKGKILNFTLSKLNISVPKTHHLENENTNYRLG